VKRLRGGLWSWFDLISNELFDLANKSKISLFKKERSKQMQKRLLVVFVALILAACGPNLSATMKTWEGSPVDRLIASWGVPNGVYTHANGDKTYTWIKQRADKYEAWTCQMSFTADKKGLIKNWSYNAC
jgi:starvation-inducible outer membrane lipoprotein